MQDWEYLQKKSPMLKIPLQLKNVQIYNSAISGLMTMNYPTFQCRKPGDQ